MGDRGGQDSWWRQCTNPGPETSACFQHSTQATSPCYPVSSSVRWSLKSSRFTGHWRLKSTNMWGLRSMSAYQQKSRLPACCPNSQVHSEPAKVYQICLILHIQKAHLNLTPQKQNKTTITRKQKEVLSIPKHAPESRMTRCLSKWL